MEAELEKVMKDEHEGDYDKLLLITALFSDG